MAAAMTSPSYSRTTKVQLLMGVSSGIGVLGLAACFHKTSIFDQKLYCRFCFFHVAQPSLSKNSINVRKMSIKNSSDSSRLDPPPSNSTNGSPRLIRTIRAIQKKLGLRIQELRKNLPMKLLFFFIGFYCATAFSTVIGQTGDWDILSAALAVVVVEGIGALMYRASLPLLNKIRSLITMFNYWKTGLSLGLFLDSFKY